MAATDQTVRQQAFGLSFSDTFQLLGVTLNGALVAAPLLKTPDHLDASAGH